MRATPLSAPSHCGTATSAPGRHRRSLALPTDRDHMPHTTQPRNACSLGPAGLGVLEPVFASRGQLGPRAARRAGPTPT